MPPITHPESFDELYVVSDLHLGGQKSDGQNFQIFNRGKRLGKLIEWIAKQRLQDQVALLLNGDIFDSLSERHETRYAALDVADAQRMLDRIWTDASFKPVWDALVTLVATPNRTLVLVIGNHDIEIALPHVQAFLCARLAAGDPARLARLRFATTGAGFACQVGAARVFCTHGNEVDDWNWVDYNRLGQLGNAVNAARRVDESRWEPNAGTRLVIDVMNKVKTKFPFVDLLKPETEPVLSAILTIGKDALEGVDLEDAFPIVKDKVGGGRVTKDLLSATTDAPAAARLRPPPVERLMGANLREVAHATPRRGGAASEDALLRAAEERHATGASATERASLEPSSGKPAETLGWFGLFVDRLRQVSPQEALRAALKDWLKDDTTFDVGTRDETYDRIIERVGPGVHVVITGHTHLARAIPSALHPFYFNTGTWIRLLRLTKEALASEAAFKPAWDAIASGLMERLDEATIPGPNDTAQPFLFDRTNVVRISADATGVTGQLLRVIDKQDGSDIDLIDEDPSAAKFALRS